MFVISGSNIMIIFPDQHGDAMDEMTFAQPQHTEDQSAYGNGNLPFMALFHLKTIWWNCAILIRTLK